MNYLTNFYKNKAEQLQEQINILEKFLSEDLSGLCGSSTDIIGLPKQGTFVGSLSSDTSNDYNILHGSSSEENVSKLLQARSQREAENESRYQEGLEKGAPLFAWDRKSRARTGSMLRPVDQTLPVSDLESFVSASPDQQQRIIKAAPTRDLEKLTDTQYRIAKGYVEAGNPNKKMGENRVNAMNAVYNELEDRKSPLGGSAVRQSFVDTWMRDPNSVRTEKSMTAIGTTPGINLAMLDTFDKEAKRQFNTNKDKRLSPEFIDTVNNFYAISDQKRKNEEKSNQISPQELKWKTRSLEQNINDPEYVEWRIKHPYG